MFRVQDYRDTVLSVLAQYHAVLIGGMAVQHWMPKEVHLYPHLDMEGDYDVMVPKSKENAIAQTFLSRLRRFAPNIEKHVEQDGKLCRIVAKDTGRVLIDLVPVNNDILRNMPAVRVEYNHSHYYVVTPPCLRTHLLLLLYKTTHVTKRARAYERLHLLNQHCPEKSRNALPHMTVPQQVMHPYLEALTRALVETGSALIGATMDGLEYLFHTHGGGVRPLGGYDTFLFSVVTADRSRFKGAFEQHLAPGAKRFLQDTTMSCKPTSDHSVDTWILSDPIELYRLDFGDDRTMPFMVVYQHRDGSSLQHLPTVRLFDNVPVLSPSMLLSHYFYNRFNVNPCLFPDEMRKSLALIEQVVLYAETHNVQEDGQKSDLLPDIDAYDSMAEWGLWCSTV